MAVTAIVLDGITFDPADLQADGGYGYLRPVTVQGVDYIWMHAMFVAGLAEIDARAVAAGGAVASFRMTFDNGTSDADPGTGKVRLNNATQNTATAIYMNETDGGGVNIASVIQSWDNSTSTVKGYLRIQHREDATKWLEFDLSGSITDSGTYDALTVAIRASSSSSPFANGDPVAVGFVPKGDKGETGDAGTAASTSTAGIVELLVQAELDAGTDTMRVPTADLLTESLGNKGSDIASATALTLPAVGDVFDVTGTTAITSISSRAAGRHVVLQFDDALTLTHHGTSLKLPGGANITTAAGDMALFVSEGSGNWRCASYQVSSKRELLQGTHEFYVDAGAMIPATTNGAAAGTTETGTNKITYATKDFDQTTQEFAHFKIRMPKSWNEGTVSFIPDWTAASGSGDVVWALQGVAVGNDDAIDAAFGTEQTSTDTLIATGDQHAGPESSAITIAGTPAAGDMVYFRVKRNPSDGGDTLNADAKLLGITVRMTIDAGSDA